MNRSTHRLGRPRRALVLLTALTAAAAVVLPTTGAYAGKPPPPTSGPPPDRIVVVVNSNLTGLPQASGTPGLIVEAFPQAFSVTATLRNKQGTAVPFSNQTATKLVLTASHGGLAGPMAASVPAGGSSFEFRGLSLGVANGVVLKVSAVEPEAASKLSPGSSPSFDVVTDVALKRVPAGNQPLVVTKGATPCEPTPDVPTCVDVVLPAGLVTPNVFFSTGSCAGIACRADDLDVLQVLADIEGRYDKRAPATLIVKCDKSLCGGGAIQSNVLRASLEPSGPLAAVPACARKGVIDPDRAIESCVDYVQSKRDGSGDTYLYWLITRDARFSI